MKKLEKRVKDLEDQNKILKGTVAFMALTMTQMCILIAQNSKFVGVAGMDEEIAKYKALLKNSGKIIAGK